MREKSNFAYQTLELITFIMHTKSKSCLLFQQMQGRKAPSDGRIQVSNNNSFPRSVGCKRRFSGLLEISHWNAHAETPCTAVTCGKSHTPPNLPECKLLESNHYACEIERLSKQDCGKEEQMITILGIKIPWESRGSKEKGRG